MVGDTAVPAPIETVRNMVSDTMGVMNELLIAMDDTSLAIYGNPGVMPEDKMQEPTGLYQEMACLQSCVKLALQKFVDIKKGMV